MSNIFSAPIVELKELNNLFIELTAKNCNQRCKHCYIDFPITKNIKDFISIDKIKKALSEPEVTANLKCIYLTGAEPMTHPDFNNILRLCLKYSSVCICTNASFINEKKARFLKKVEDEGSNEIIFKLSIDHFNEVKNDDIRGRGAYRQTLNAVKNLAKYGFNPILNITNYYKEEDKILMSEFSALYKKHGLESTDFNFCINTFFDKYKPEVDNVELKSGKYDCYSSRVLSDKGVYVCPFLANDHRGWMGADFSDFSKKMHLESDYCMTCSKNTKQMFSIDWSSL